MINSMLNFLNKILSPSHTGIQLTALLRLALTQQSCFLILSAGVTGVCYLPEESPIIYTG